MVISQHLVVDGSERGLVAAGDLGEQAGQIGSRGGRRRPALARQLCGHRRALTLLIRGWSQFGLPSAVTAPILIGVDYEYMM